jgi:hypothetical protein
MQHKIKFEGIIIYKVCFAFLWWSLYMNQGVRCTDRNIVPDYKNILHNPFMILLGIKVHKF